MGMLMHRHASYRNRNQTRSEPEAPVTSAPELIDLTVRQLRGLATSEGVDLSGLTRKGEIVAAIEAHRATPPAPPEAPEPPESPVPPGPPGPSGPSGQASDEQDDEESGAVLVDGQGAQGE